MKRFCVYGQSLLLLVLLLCAASGTANAQAGSADLRGTVEDASHGVVAGATITVINTGTGAVRMTTSNSEGTFSVSDLTPATYRVQISAPSFGTVTYAQVTLSVGKEQVLNPKLRPGAVTSTVEVQSGVTGVELASSSLGGNVNQRAMENLPLNGRDWTSLTEMLPGVGVARLQNNLNASSSNRSSRGLGQQVTINGNRPTQNAYFQDGLNINDYANSTPGNAFGLTLGLDAIQEFTVITSNFNATYGQASGGVINAVTRSGTNRFHGDVYEYLRNNFFDARNHFDPAAIPPLHRNQFGVAAGGPIWKNHTFFFANYEGYREIKNVTTTDVTPSPDARNGFLCSGTGCTGHTTITVNANMVPYLALFPLPNNPALPAGSTLGPTGNADTGAYSFVARTVNRDDYGTMRVDHIISERDSLYGMFTGESSSTSSPDAYNDITVSTRLSRHSSSVTETHIFSPSLLNVYRMGVNFVVAHGLNSSPGNNPAAASTALGILPGRAAPYLTVGSGVTAYTGGLNGLATTNFVFVTPQFYDDVSWQKKAHTLKFGVEFTHDNSNEQVASVPNGEYDFNSLSGFLQNQPSIFYADLQYAPGQTNGVPVGVGFPERGFRQSIYGLYINDDWRVRPNLTLNLGVRYERSSVPTEEHGRISNLYSSSSTNLNPGAPLFSNPTNRNFEPRVGVIWDPFGKGKSSVRGSFGIFDVLPLLYEYSLVEGYAAPASSLAQISGQAPGSFPNGGYQQVITLPSVPLRVAQVQQNPPRNYIMQWNLSVQQQLTSNTTLTVAYAGNHGVHMPDVANDTNYNTPVYNATAGGYQFTQGTRNTAIGGIRQVEWWDSSNYNGLQILLERRFEHGLQFKGAYTYSRSLDGFSSSSFPTAYQNSLSTLFFSHKLVHGPSDYDQEHVAVLSAVWDLPKLTGSYAAVRQVTNGWTVTGLMQMNSGEPFTPVISGDVLGEGVSSPYDVPNYVPSNAGCNGRKINQGNVTHYINTACYSFAGSLATNGVIGNAGRNSIYGPGLFELDNSIMRNFKLPFLGQAGRLQMRLDAFNITNHTNLQGPVTNNKIFSGSTATTTPTSVATAGLITLTSTTSRQLQISAKVYW
jgi:hypothetical protein